MAKRKILVVLFLTTISVFLFGCRSYRATSTLKPQQDADLAYDGIKFGIDQIRFDPKKETFVPAPEYNARAIKTYPSLFSSEAYAWPLRVTVETIERPGIDLTALCVFTLGVFPAWNERTVQYKITVEIPGCETKQGTFEIETVGWEGWIPLLIPVPGTSDARDHFNYEISAYTESCIVEAISQRLKDIDARSLSNLRDPAEVAKLALNDPSDRVRKVAVTKVSPTSLFYSRLASEELEKANRFFIEAPLQVVKTIASEAPDTKVRQAALRHVRDESFIQTAAQNDPDASVRQTAINLVEEGVDWALAEKAGTLSAYKEFLQKHPSTTRLNVTTAGRNYTAISTIWHQGVGTWGNGFVKDEQDNLFKVSLGMACAAGMVDDPDAEKPRPSVNDFQNYQQEQQRKSRQKFRLYSADFGKENCRVVAIELINP